MMGAADRTARSLACFPMFFESVEPFERSCAKVAESCCRACPSRAGSYESNAQWRGGVPS